MYAQVDGDTSHYSNQAVLDFDMELVDPCTGVSFAIDPSILSSLDIEYTIGQVAHQETLLSTLVTPSVTGLTCPPMELTVLQADGLPMDSEAFTYDPDSQVFQVETADESFNQTTFDLQIKAKYEGSQFAYTGTLDFKVLLIAKEQVYTVEVA